MGHFYGVSTGQEAIPVTISPLAQRAHRAFMSLYDAPRRALCARPITAHHEAFSMSSPYLSYLRETVYVPGYKKKHQ